MQPTATHDTVTRRPTRWLLGVLVVVLIVGAMAAAWYFYVRSPAYSVGRIARAVETRDWVEFERYVDVDSVVEYAVDDALAELVDPDSELGRLAESLGESVKPALIKQSRNVLRSTIESGRVKFNNRLGPLGSHAVALKAKTVERQDDVAVVRLPVPIAGKQVDLLLRMQRTGDYWRVVRLENPQDLPVGGLRE